MTQAKSGDHVRVHYTGKLEDGTVFDSSLEKAPLDFTIGQAQLIQGFQDAVIGMRQGDSRSFTLKAEDAYGPYHDNLVQEVERADLAEDLQQVEVGTRLKATDGQGNSLAVTVTNVTETTLTLDANHPLAGEDLAFEVSLVEIL